MKKIYAFLYNLRTLNAIIIVLLFILPYYLFEGKLFLGGDDTRIFYIFPFEYIQNIAFYSWSSFSSLGLHNPNQFSIPLLVLFGLLKLISPSLAFLNYLSFSLPFVIGLLYFQRFISQLIPQEKGGWAAFLGSLIYIFSPVIILTQMSVFLITVWFFAILPAIAMHFLKYIRTSNMKYVWVNVIVCFVFSIAFYSIPWMLGLLLPLAVGWLLCIHLFKIDVLGSFLIKFVIYFGLLLLSQLFWILPFFSTFLTSYESSFAGNTLTSNVVNTFRPTVLATATGNIIYPLLNLPHRAIAFDFNWQIKPVFVSHYDKIIFLNLIFIFIIFGGLLFYKKTLSTNERKVFVAFFLSFIFSLFFYTVNVGPLKEVFIFFGNIPGFVMFRNFYDKFALGYVFLYSIIFSYCLYIVGKMFSRYKTTIYCIVFFVIAINAIPIKQIVNSPLWGTKDTFRNITLPQEYLIFLKDLKRVVPAGSYILSYPLNIASYAIIADESSKNVFAGTSPITMLTGINNLSGGLSFSPAKSVELNTLILKRDAKGLNAFLQRQNIDFILATKNIPKEALGSYLFDEEVMKQQDEQLLEEISGERILKSSKGNYVLFKTKKESSLFVPDNITFEKVSPVKYHLAFKKFSKKQEIRFYDTYHNGWKIYPSKIKNARVDEGQSFLEAISSYIGDTLFLLKNPLFDNSHESGRENINKWEIDPSLISTDNVNRSEESSDTMYTLYFLPQSYFYLGSLISFIVIGFGCTRLIKGYGLKR